MQWEKKGLIFTPNKQYSWIQSHAAVPTAVHLGKDDYRIFFGSRNENNKTQTGYIDVEVAKDGIHLLYISNKPVLELGKAGLFDDSAAWVSSIIRVEKDLWHMYYIGWMQGVSVPYIPSIGLAVSEDLDDWEKIHTAPIIGRDATDPYGCASMSVMYDHSAHYPMALNYKMWYLSILDYNPLEKMYYYTIRCAASDDGVEWLKDEENVAIKMKRNETRIARPCVIKDFGLLYRMWYCYATKQTPYRIGYAESINGSTWTRKDKEEGLTTSREGWDSEMVCYPYVFEHNDKRIMLYNGNDYGRTGIGYAIANFEKSVTREIT